MPTATTRPSSLRIILDTNIWISRLLDPKEAIGDFLRPFLATGQFVLLFSKQLVQKKAPPGGAYLLETLEVNAGRAVCHPHHRRIINLNLDNFHLRGECLWFVKSGPRVDK